MSVKVDHNYPGAGDMRVVNEEGQPIEGVTVKIFDHTAFHSGETSTWIAETLTDLNGEWIDPTYLDEAMSYVVHFEKLTLYGPDHIEITT